MSRLGSRVPTSPAAVRRSSSWLPNTAYLAGEIVVNTGVAYAALADFTSGASFVESNWACLSSGQEVTYAEDASGTPYTLTATDTAVSLAITLPLSSRVMWLTAEAWVQQTTTPAAGTTGQAAMTVVDNQGTPVTVGGDIASFEPAGNTSYALMRARCRIAANTPSRIYTLHFSRSNNAFRGSIMNAFAGGQFRSYMQAVYA